MLPTGSAMVVADDCALAGGFVGVARDFGGGVPKRSTCIAFITGIGVACASGVGVMGMARLTSGPEDGALVIWALSITVPAMSREGRRIRAPLRVFTVRGPRG